MWSPGVLAGQKDLQHHKERIDEIPYLTEDSNFITASKQRHTKKHSTRVSNCPNNLQKIISSPLKSCQKKDCSNEFFERSREQKSQTSRKAWRSGRHAWARRCPRRASRTWARASWATEAPRAPAPPCRLPPVPASRMEAVRLRASLLPSQR